MHAESRRRTVARSAVLAGAFVAFALVAGCATDGDAESIAMSAPTSDLSGAGDAVGQELFTAYLASIGTSDETLAGVGDGGE